MAKIKKVFKLINLLLPLPRCINREFAIFDIFISNYAYTVNNKTLKEENFCNLLGSLIL